MCQSIDFFSETCPIMKRNLLLFYWFLGSITYAQTSVITLKPGHLNANNKDFFVAKVLDLRKGTTNIGRVLNGQAEATNAILGNNTTQAIEAFLNRNFNAQKTDTLTPITLTIKEFKITEKLISGNYVAGNLTMNLGFETYQEGKRVELTSANSGSSYTRPLKQNETVEQVIRKSLESQLKGFGNWYVQNNKTFGKLARRVQLIFDEDSLKTESPNGDTIYYSAKRRLTWNDFKGRPSLFSRWAAQIFASFGFEASAKVKNRVLELRVQPSVWTDRTISWVQPSAKNDYTLAHEQLHFDITKLIVERFKQKLRSMTFSIEDYSSEIQYQYLEFYRDLGELQQQYDQQTDHGLDKAQQAAWSEKIQKELCFFGVMLPK